MKVINVFAGVRRTAALRDMHYSTPTRTQYVQVSVAASGICTLRLCMLQCLTNTDLVHEDIMV